MEGASSNIHRIHVYSRSPRSPWMLMRFGCILWPMVRSRGTSPTLGLFFGLIVTLAAVVAYSWYITVQISGLKKLQTDLTERDRKDSLQLLRAQDDLNSLGLAMRDMLDTDEPYPITAWSMTLSGAKRALPLRAVHRSNASTWRLRSRNSGMPCTARSSWPSKATTAKQETRSASLCRRDGPL
jgi:hypothetical protein